ncbi:PIG-L family deacetylase [Paenibacillus amylolyticus]|uniref:PIG-L family deacetylase n=1 Tax=Paenibacillus amylolyticus TaxID=1451 RepID=UPI003EB7458B
MKQIHSDINPADWPAIFYVPHADDDAIGYAGAIAEHKAVGRPVYVVLVASGHNDGLLKIMKGETTCRLGGRPGFENHPKKHDFTAMSSYDIHNFRKQEFERSVTNILGADKVYYAGDSGDCIFDGLFYTNYNAAVQMVRSTIQLMAQYYPNASHKFVSGPTDKYPTDKRTVLNVTHKAVYEAAVQCCIGEPYIKDVRFYRVYSYWDNRNPLHSHTDFIFHNEAAWQDKKREALNCYKDYNPALQRYALGYHSVPELIDSAYESTKTYIDLFPEEITLYEKPVALQAHEGLYMRHPYQHGLIYSNGNWIEDEQEFLPIWHSEFIDGSGKKDRVVLAAVGKVNKSNYLSIVETGDNKGAIRYSSKPEPFTVYPVGFNKIALLASNGLFLRAYKSNEAYPAKADSAKIDVWETYTLMSRHSGCGISSVSANGKLYVFTREADQSLIYRIWDGVNWTEWKTLGNDFKSGPKAIVQKNPRYGDILTVFACHEDGTLQYRSLVDSHWSEKWLSTELEITSQPEVILYNNTPHIFARGKAPERYTMHIWLDQKWESENLDAGENDKRIISGIKAISYGENSGFMIYAKLKDENYSWCCRHWLDSWYGWFPLTDMQSTADPDIASPPEIILLNGATNIFVRGADSFLWRYHIYDQNLGGWEQTDWKISSAPKAVMNGSQICIFAQKADSMDLECRLWTGSGWSVKPMTAGSPVSSEPEAVIHDNALHCFVRGEDSDVLKNEIKSGLYHAYELDDGFQFEFLGEQII